MKLKLFLLSQEENTGWDTHDSCVVVAKDIESAKRILPVDYLTTFAECSTWASKPENVIAKEIGTANAGYKEGQVIITSFNAG